VEKFAKKEDAVKYVKFSFKALKIKL